MRSKLDRVNDWEVRAHECGYSASKLAEAVGVTLRLLEIFFRERFHEGPHEWTVRVRMTEAAGFVRSGLPLKSVASKVCYKQVSHFSREFKCFFGLPPSQYVFGGSNHRYVTNRCRGFRI
jgi:transcriptional regulator GlxA family with amidase domain